FWCASAGVFPFAPLTYVDLGCRPQNRLIADLRIAGERSSGDRPLSTRPTPAAALRIPAAHVLDQLSNLGVIARVVRGYALVGLGQDGESGHEGVLRIGAQLFL